MPFPCSYAFAFLPTHLPHHPLCPHTRFTAPTRTPSCPHLLHFALYTPAFWHFSNIWALLVLVLTGTYCSQFRHRLLFVHFCLCTRLCACRFLTCLLDSINVGRHCGGSSQFAPILYYLPTILCVCACTFPLPCIIYHGLCYIIAVCLYTPAFCLYISLPISLPTYLFSHLPYTFWTCCCVVFACTHAACLHHACHDTFVALALRVFCVTVTFQEASSLLRAFETHCTHPFYAWGSLLLGLTGHCTEHSTLYLLYVSRREGSPDLMKYAPRRATIVVPFLLVPLLILTHLSSPTRFGQAGISLHTFLFACVPLCLVLDGVSVLPTLYLHYYPY